MSQQPATGLRWCCSTAGRSTGTPAGWKDYSDDFRLELLDGLGHFLVDQETDVAGARVLEFLRR